MANFCGRASVHVCIVHLHHLVCTYVHWLAKSIIIYTCMFTIFHPDCCLGDISMTTVTKIPMQIIDIIMDLTRECVCVHAWVRVSVSLFPGTLGTYVRARVCMYINYISVFVLYEYVLPLNFYSRWCAVTLCL